MSKLFILSSLILSLSCLAASQRFYRPMVDTGRWGMAYVHSGSDVDFCKSKGFYTANTVVDSDGGEVTVHVNQQGEVTQIFDADEDMPYVHEITCMRID